ncbi:histone-lysine N-methyltransferase SETMAR [Trichonephila clavipes]|nr:histone-lysine N-methyltransferase SETMAR [Trichonephila clavipes]
MIGRPVAWMGALSSRKIPFRAGNKVSIMGWTWSTKKISLHFFPVILPFRVTIVRAENHDMAPFITVDNCPLESEKEHLRHCWNTISIRSVRKPRAECSNIFQVYGEDAIDESTCRRWFRKFRDGDRSYQDQAWSGRTSHLREDDINQAIRNNPTVHKLAKTFNVHRTTVERRLVCLGFTRTLDRWVPHNMTAMQRDDRIATCVFFLSRYKNDPLLKRIVKEDDVP